MRGRLGRRLISFGRAGKGGSRGSRGKWTRNWNACSGYILANSHTRLWVFESSGVWVGRPGKTLSPIHRTKDTEYEEDVKLRVVQGVKQMI